MPENTTAINNFEMRWKGVGRFAFSVISQVNGNGQFVVQILLTNEADEP